MFSADIPLFFLRMLLIKLLLLGCRFPKCHEMIVFAVFVFPYFKNESVQLLSHPANRPILLWHVGALVKVVGLLKDLLRLDSPLSVCSSVRQSRSAFWYNCYTRIIHSSYTWIRTK